jgi:hypothetical protein
MSSRRPVVVAFGVVALTLIVSSIALGLGERSEDGSSAEQYSSAHRRLADEVRTLMAENPNAFAPADRTILGKLDYLADVGYVVEGVVTDTKGPPVEIVEGMTIYDPTSDDLPGAVLEDVAIVRRYEELAGDPFESLIEEGGPLAVDFGSGIVQVGRRYQFFVTSNGYAMLIVDAEEESVVEGSFHPSNNGAKALARLLELRPGASPGAEVLALTDEFHANDGSRPSGSRLGQLLGETVGKSGQPPGLADDRYPTTADPAEAEAQGLVPFEILVLGTGDEPPGTLYSVRGKRDLDSWAVIHEERHYAVVAGYIEPGDSVQLLTKGSPAGPARPLAVRGVRGNKIQMPEEVGPGGLAAIVDLRPASSETLRVFASRETYLDALEPLMQVLNVAEAGPEPEADSGSSAPSGSISGGASPSTTEPPVSTTTTQP